MNVEHAKDIETRLRVAKMTKNDEATGETERWWSTYYALDVQALIDLIEEKDGRSDYSG